MRFSGCCLKNEGFLQKTLVRLCIAHPVYHPLDISSTLTCTVVVLLVERSQHLGSQMSCNCYTPTVVAVFLRFVLRIDLALDPLVEFTWNSYVVN